MYDLSNHLRLQGSQGYRFLIPSQNYRVYTEIPN